MAKANIPAWVFISYSHKNLKEFERLQTYLAAYALNREIFVWSDRDRSSPESSVQCGSS